ncbi:hypothetical protein DHD32_22255 [Arenibacter sp. TNZ]|nr:hypothetical protein [Arenibacter sp. TNZ]
MTLAIHLFFGIFNHSKYNREAMEHFNGQKWMWLGSGKVKISFRSLFFPEATRMSGMRSGKI